MAITSDGLTLVVTNHANDSVTLSDTVSLGPDGRGPLGVTFSPEAGPAASRYPTQSIGPGSPTLCSRWVRVGPGLDGFVRFRGETRDEGKSACAEQRRNCGAGVSTATRSPSDKTGAEPN
jgi:hypothetical protein